MIPGYDHENRRVWKKNTQEEYYFYGAFGELIGRYQKITGTDCPSCQGFQVLARNVYFAGKLIRSQDGVAVVDRLGSVVGRNTEQTPYQTLRFCPFGEIQSEANGSTNREKVATYFRDGLSNLDYAQNRYYSSRIGRFLTPDPFAGSAKPANLLSCAEIGVSP